MRKPKLPDPAEGFHTLRVTSFTPKGREVSSQWAVDAALHALAPDLLDRELAKLTKDHFARLDEASAQEKANG